MRAALSLLLVCFLCNRLWGQSQSLGRPQTIVFSRTYLAEQLALLESDGLLTSEAALAHSEHYESLLLLGGIDLGTIPLEQLMQIPLMTEYRAYQLVRYRQEQGELRSIEELKLIPGWDSDFVDYLSPLLRWQSQDARPATWSELLAGGKSRAAILLSLPMGHKDKTQYLGSPEALSLRYRWQSGDALSAFLGADKDSYEPWQYARHKGFDSYHGHVVIRRRGWLEGLTLGQFRASWGEGLALNQGFGSRSLMHTGNASGRAYRGLNSTSEAGYSQGVALELRLGKHLYLSALASAKRIDGRPSDEGEDFSALSESGLHRSPSEWSKRGKILQRHYGGSLSLQYPRGSIALHAIAYDWGGLRLGKATGAAYHEGLRQLRGFGNISLAHQYSNARGNLGSYGEVARSDNGAWATQQRLSLSGRSWGRLQLALRYIAPDYWAYHASALTHYSLPHNEMGIAFAYQTNSLLRHSTLSLEGDLYRSVRERTRGMESGGYLRLLVERRLGRLYQLHLRTSYNWDGLRGDGKLALRTALHYRSGLWQGSLTAETKKLVGSSPTSQASATTTLSPTPQSTTSPWGYLLSGRIAYTSPRGWRASAQLTYHNTPSWQGRIYVSEHRLSEEYGMSSALYGKGIRATLLWSGDFGRNLRIGIKGIYHHRSPRATHPTSLSLQATYRS